MLELSQTALEVLSAAWATMVGAVVGSFLNVVIARVPREQSIVRPGSRCPRCATPIRWYDNIPIFSWIALRARCRACRAPISARYPLVEALGGGLAFLAWYRHGLTPAAAAELAFAAALLALAFIDLDTWLLPNVITWPLIGFGLGMSALGLSAAPSFRESLYGAGLGFAAFAAVSWLGAKAFRKEALGFGDVWLLAGLGAWLGVKALLPMILFASLQGTVIGIVFIVLRREEPAAPAGPVPEKLPNPAPEAAGPVPEKSADAAPAAPVPAAPVPEELAEDPAAPPAHLPEKLEGPAAPVPEKEEPEWKPDRHHVPFGPFLVAGAFEWLYLSAWFAGWVPMLWVFR